MRHSVGHVANVANKSNNTMPKFILAFCQISTCIVTSQFYSRDTDWETKQNTKFAWELEARGEYFS